MDVLFLVLCFNDKWLGKEKGRCEASLSFLFFHSLKIPEWLTPLTVVIIIGKIE